MDIHVVRPGETLTAIAAQHSVPLSRLLADNQLPDPGQLVTGQTIVIRYPAEVYTVRPGDTLTAIAAANGLTVRQLLRQNPNLRGEETIYPGQTLVLRYQGEKRGTLSVNGYAYPFIDKGLLQRELPFLTNLTPFTYGITPQGGLVDLDDASMIAAAKSLGVAPLMHLSTLTQEGGFSNELASLVLNDRRFQDNLVTAIRETLQAKGYRGLDVDFEFVFSQDAGPYAAFIARLRRELAPLGYPVIVALAPKTSATQPGLLYEGHNYRALGQAADQVLLMTYGYFFQLHSFRVFFTFFAVSCQIQQFFTLCGELEMYLDMLPVMDNDAVDQVDHRGTVKGLDIAVLSEELHKFIIGPPGFPEVLGSLLQLGYVFLLYGDLLGVLASELFVFALVDQAALETVIELEFGFCQPLFLPLRPIDGCGVLVSVRYPLGGLLSR